MSMSTFQKVTLVSCLVLCVSLLLPKMLLSRGKKEVGQPEVGPGRFPPMMHRQQMSDGQWGAGPQYSRANPEAIAKAKGGGIGGGGKSNLMGQIIPIYGFGILLYILYILFKITSKGKISKPDNRFPALKSENMKRKITDYELAQLQEKLKETEEVMERIVSKASHSPDRIKSVSAEHEEKLLRQLKEITRVMQEGRLVEGVSPEMEAEEASYTEDWEGYPEETYPQYDEPCCRQRYETIILEEPAGKMPTPEELAERMEEGLEQAGQTEPVEEEGSEEKVPPLSEAPPLPQAPPLPEAPPKETKGERAGPRRKGGKQISFSNQKEVFHYPEEGACDSYENENPKRVELVKEEEEEEEEEEAEEEEYENEEEEEEEEEEVEDDEDPAVMAESVSFNCQVCSDPQELGDMEEFFHADEQEDGDEQAESEIANELSFSVLRKRNKKEAE